MMETGIQSVRINGSRLEDRLYAMRAIGKAAGGGVSREALNDADVEGRHLLIRWFEDAGCQIHIDDIGNIFAVKKGFGQALAPVLTGSHNDTQPNGGHLDGTLGILAGLEVIATLNDQGIKHARDIVVAIWTNEEGTRFTPGCTGSGVWTGVLDKDAMYRLQDTSGITLREELIRSGFLGAGPFDPGPVYAAFELHIEQGPVLDAMHIPIGIVEGIVAPHWYNVTLTGEANHAGSTPMTMRRDPLLAFCRIGNMLNDRAHACENLVATVGEIHVSPNSRNVIPGAVRFSLDIRGWKEQQTEEFCAQIELAIQQIAQECRCTVNLDKIWHEQRTDFDPRLRQIIRESCQVLQLSSMEMHSGANHDMVYVSRVAPSAMIFVPSIGGKSHSPAENTAISDCIAGTNVLFQSMVRCANEYELKNDC